MPFDFAPALWALLTLLLQALLLILSLVRLVRQQRKWAPALALLLPLGTTLLIGTMGESWIGTEQARRERDGCIQRIKRYEVIIAQVKQSPGAAIKVLESSGESYRLQPGQPLRVAFVQPNGILDNFKAVVYDPSGLVLQANQFQGSANSANWANWDDPRLQHIKKLFDGDLVWADHLEGPWYLCGFT